MPLNSLPDAALNLPEMKTKSPSCPAGGVHMYEEILCAHAQYICIVPVLYMQSIRKLQ